MSEYSDMSYGDLRKAAVAAGLPGNGTKEELVARLEAGAAAPSNEPNEPDPSTEPAETTETNTEPEKDDPTPASEKKIEKQIEKEHRQDAQKMKEHLAKQKKVSIMIPFDEGVKPEDGEKIPFVVNLNGYRMDFKRGTYVDVPIQVAEIIKERLQSEGKLGREHLVSANSQRVEALA